MTTDTTQPIEILLWEIEFDKKYLVTMSFLIEITKNKPKIYWAVAASGTNISPILFFSDYDSALENMQKRCGIATLDGHTIVMNNKYGEIRGFYDRDCVQQQGLSKHKVETQVDDDNKGKGATKIIKRF